MKNKAKEILEEFASSYSEVDIERLANSLEEIRKEVEHKIISAEVSKQERFAEKYGFTPDCTPYYIAEQYRHRTEVAEYALKQLAIFAVREGTVNLEKEKEDLLVNDMFDGWIKQAEKELSEENKKMT